MKQLLFIFSFLMIVSIAAVEANDALHSAIASANAQWSKEYNAGNAAGVAACYAENAKLLPPNSDFVSAHSAIQKFWQGVIDAGIKSAKFETVEVTGMGSDAAEVGMYELMTADGKTADKGKYIVLWKKVGSEWKLYRDIWSSSMPASGAAK
jgi:ketosteroid isomerase-like protein